MMLKKYYVCFFTYYSPNSSCPHSFFWLLCVADLVTQTSLPCIQTEGIHKQSAFQYMHFVLLVPEHSVLFIFTSYNAAVDFPIVDIQYLFV